MDFLKVSGNRKFLSARERERERGRKSKSEQARERWSVCEGERASEREEER